MIELFKIITGRYDRGLAPDIHINDSFVTRGNKYKLIKDSFHYDIRKFSFTSRIVNVWNSLPNSVVDADSVDIFKSRLPVDKFWLHQEVLYDYTAELTGIGDRSEYVDVKVT